MKQVLRGSILVVLGGAMVVLVIRGIAAPAGAKPAGGVAAHGTGDVNGDGTLDLSDAIGILVHLFGDGPAPVACADSPELVGRVAALEGSVIELQNALSALRAETAPLSHTHLEFEAFQLELAALRSLTGDESVRVFASEPTGHQVIPVSSTTALRFRGESWDPQNLHDTETNPERLTARRAGRYIIFGAVRWDPVRSAHREVSIRLNGSTRIASEVHAVSEGWVEVASETTSTMYSLREGDYVELLVRHFTSNGGPEDASIVTEGSETTFGMLRLPTEP